MDDQQKDNSDPKRPPKKEPPQQLKIHNVPTDDVENTNSTSKGGDLQFTEKPRIVPWGSEKM